jgi:hypothetical protein
MSPPSSFVCSPKLMETIQFPLVNVSLNPTFVSFPYLIVSENGIVVLSSTSLHSKSPLLWGWV